MTELTAPVRTSAHHPPAGPHLVRWLLRLHRPSLYIWTGFVVAAAVTLLLLWGPVTDAAAEAWRQYNACGMSDCAYDQAAILRYKTVDEYTTIAVLAPPFLVAAWAGAALIGRELESGTARFAWTQAVSPTRWLAAKLAVPAALVTAGTGLLVLLHHLAWSAADGPIDTAQPWWGSLNFYANGPVTVALTLTGLAIGALAGLLLRRSLAALGTAVAAVAGLWTALATAMPHLWPTVTSVSRGLENGPSWDGIGVGSGLLTSAGARIPDQHCGSSTNPGCEALYARLDAVSFYQDYHPRSHYWPLQLTTTALVLVLAAVLALAAFRVLAHRTATATALARKEATA